jgi:diadenosine tetraphosphate (Ap4A) HIT family hydrolase
MSTPSPSADASCPFCAIADAYTPTTALHDPTLVSPPAFVVLSAPLCLAFLDILPLSPGHLLVTTRTHREKLSDISAPEAAELGRWLRVLSRVLAHATGVLDWNIVQNNGTYVMYDIWIWVWFVSEGEVVALLKECGWAARRWSCECGEAC